jgi:Zn-dependent protease
VSNLIPIPPLDGSRVVQYFLPRDMLVVYRKIEQFGLLVIIFLVFFIEPVNTLLTTVVVSTLEVLTTIFGLSGVVASVA